MVIDDKTIVSRPRDLESNFVDDEDLQATLAGSRRVKILKTTKLSPQEIAAKVAAERARDKAEDETAGGLTFDDTSEFIRAIHYNPLEVASEPAPPPADEIGEIEVGEVKVESRLTVETQKISEPPLDSTTINLIMFYHIFWCTNFTART